MCLAVTSDDELSFELCNFDSARQKFYWRAGTSIVNAPTNFCLTVKHLPPTGIAPHVAYCDRKMQFTHQSWSSDGFHIEIPWVPSLGPRNQFPTIYRLQYNSNTDKVSKSCYSF